MNRYEIKAKAEVEAWKRKMTAHPGLFSKGTAALQSKINTYIPEKAHIAITKAIKAMVEAVLFGSGFTSTTKYHERQLMLIEWKVKKKIDSYSTTAAIEGGVTGLGGLLAGLANFPLFLAIKMKMLFEIGTLYGHDMQAIHERVFLLQLFQLTLSSQQNRRQVFLNVFKPGRNFNDQQAGDFDWSKFQQEYRDSMDLAKLAQLIPGIGAVVGYVVNRKYTKKLGDYAINAYRMRRFEMQGEG